MLHGNFYQEDVNGFVFKQAEKTGKNLTNRILLWHN